MNLIEDLTSEHLELESEYESELETSNTNRKLRIQSSTEMNVLTNRLKYAHLGGYEIFLSTTLSRLATNQEKNLLKSRRKTSDLIITAKSLSPFLIKHHIQLKK